MRRQGNKIQTSVSRGECCRTIVAELREQFRLAFQSAFRSEERRSSAPWSSNSPGDALQTVSLSVLLRFSAAGLVVAWLVVCPAGAQSPSGKSWTANDDMLVFFEAVNAIRDTSLHDVEGRRIMQRSLKAFVQTLDPFSDYWTPEEYAVYLESRSTDFAGVGMELVADLEGNIHSVPYPGGPAALAGVRENDRLVSVDGAPVEGQSLLNIGARVRGKPDTAVVLGLERAHGTLQSVHVTRRPMNASTALPVPAEGVALVRVYTFSRETPGDMTEAVRGHAPDVPIVIDLRGCAGGGVFDAIDAARIFLPKGTVIAGIRTRDSTTTYRSDREPVFPDRRVFVLQDERTASAAELFAGALVGNDRATSIGSHRQGH